LLEHVDFTALPLNSTWQALCAEQGSTAQPYIDDLGLTMTPASCATDGFFISILQREKIVT